MRRQPSHDWSASNPALDFNINAKGFKYFRMYANLQRIQLWST